MAFPVSREYATDCLQFPDEVAAFHAGMAIFLDRTG